MQSDSFNDARGYAQTTFRLEYRPTYGLHSKDELLHILDVLAETGVKAWWYSAASKGSYPMFKSKFLPYRDDAVEPEFFQWLSKETHKRNIVFMSWEYLTTAPILAADHPEWCWKPFDWDGPKTERDRQYVCWNSPYGEMLKKYSLEVVSDCGFDGIWFDGSFMHGHGMTGRFACCCDFCAEKYKAETGREIPSTIDLSDLACREYFIWRNNDHMRYWRELSEYVKTNKDDAIIAYNYFNRFGNGLDCGTPLQQLSDDKTSMLVTEAGFHYQQIPVLAKAMRSVNSNYLPELWTYMADSPVAITAQPDSTPLIYYAQRCAANGAYASYGIGRENISDYTRTLKEIGEKINPLHDYLGGKSLAMVAVVLSGATKDFGYISADGRNYDDTIVWNQVCGMTALLDSLHIQSNIILDDMLTLDDLSKYEAIILPGVKCISDDSAEQLKNYVSAGGTLLAIGECGTIDMLGRPRSSGILNGLFGIKLQETKPTVLELDNGVIYPGSGSAFNSACDDRKDCTYRYDRQRKFARDRVLPPDPAKLRHAQAISSCQYGKGTAIYIAPEIAYSYAYNGPNKRSRDLIANLLENKTRRFFETDALANVTINMFNVGEKIVIHLLDTPDTMVHLNMHQPGRIFPDIQLPTDFSTLEPFEIKIPGNWNCTEPLGQKVKIEHNYNGQDTIVKISGFQQYAAIILTK